MVERKPQSSFQGWRERELLRPVSHFWSLFEATGIKMKDGQERIHVGSIRGRQWEGSFQRGIVVRILSQSIRTTGPGQSAGGDALYYFTWSEPKGCTDVIQMSGHQALMNREIALRVDSQGTPRWFVGECEMISPGE